MSSNQNDFEFRLRALVAKEGLEFQRLNCSREFRRMSTGSSSDKSVASDRLTRQSISMSPRKPILSVSTPRTRSSVGSLSSMGNRSSEIEVIPASQKDRNHHEIATPSRARHEKHPAETRRLSGSRGIRRLSSGISIDESVASEPMTGRSFCMSPRKPIFSASVPKARFTVGSVSELRQRALSPRKSVSTTRARSSVPSLPSNTKRAASPKPRPSAKSDSTPLRPQSVGSRRACTSDGRQSIRESIRKTSSSVRAAYPTKSRNGFGSNGRLSARAVIRGLDCEQRDRQSKWDPTSQTQHPCVLGSGATWARSARRRALSMCPRRCHCRRRCKNS